MSRGEGGWGPGSLFGRRRWALLSIAAVVLALVVVVFASLRPSRAEEPAVFVVRSAEDEYASETSRACSSGSENCTLRAAITESNADGKANVIEFDLPGGSRTITLDASGALEIKDDVTGGDLAHEPDLKIMGPEKERVVVRGNGANTVFEVTGEESFTPGEPDERPEVVISGLEITGGGAPQGAGITSYHADLTLRDMLIRDNEASENGGGLQTFRSVVLVEDSVIRENEAAFFGGGVINAEGEITLKNTSISDNTARGDGGGIHNDEAGKLYVMGGEITNNNATSETSSGGGVSNKGGSSFSEVDLSDNTSGYAGGGIASSGTAVFTDATVAGNSSALGGGIESSGVLQFNTSTLSGNTAERGGAVHSSNALTEFAGPAISGSTIHGNESTGEHPGVVFNARGRTDIRSATITANSGGLTTAGDRFTLTTFGRTIVTGNGESDVELAFGEAPGSISSEGHNLVGSPGAPDAFTAQGDVTGLTAGEVFGTGSPVLGDWGGPTPTVPLRSEDSPAVDAIGEGDECGEQEYAATDQRRAEYVRVEGGGDGLCDVGAFEYGSAPADLLVSLEGPAKANPGETLTYVVFVEGHSNIRPDSEEHPGGLAGGTAHAVTVTLELDPPSALPGSLWTRDCEGAFCWLRDLSFVGERVPKLEVARYSGDGECYDLGGEIRCSLGNIKPNEVRTVQVDLVPTEDSGSGSFAVRASASSRNVPGETRRTIRTSTTLE